MRTYLSSTLAILFLFCQQVSSAEPVTLFSVGSGDISGNYYPVAQSLCETFNQSDETRRRCSPEPSRGSIYNLRALQEGTVEFAIVQSDWNIAAYDATGPFEGQSEMDDLRVVAPLFSEVITILVSPTSNIVNADGLFGKTVDIGRLASGRHATVKQMLEELNFSLDQFGSVRELRPAVAVDQLCAGTIDATIFVVGHPSDLVDTAISRCGARMLEFDGPNIRDLISSGGIYQRAFIDPSIYGATGANVPSLSVTATLITRTNVDETLVADFLGAIDRSASQLASDVPVLRDLPETLKTPPELGVPFHVAVESSQ